MGGSGWPKTLFFCIKYVLPQELLFVLPRPASGTAQRSWDLTMYRLLLLRAIDDKRIRLIVSETWRCYSSLVFASVPVRSTDYKLSNYRWKCQICWRYSEKPIVRSQRALSPAIDRNHTCLALVLKKYPCPNNEHFFSSEEPVLWIWIQVNLSRIQIRAWALNVYCLNTDA